MWDCAILGGGIIGLSIAVELTRHGQAVAVFDAPVSPPSASWAASGILPPPAAGATHDPLERLRTISHQMYPPWCRELEDATGVAIECAAVGGIYLARTAGERIGLAASRDQWARDGISTENWSIDQLQAREPGLDVPHDDEMLIVHLPDEAQVRPSRILRALRTWLDQRRVPIVPIASIGPWQTRGSRIVAVDSQPTSIRAHRFCLCAGPWTGQLVAQLGVQIAVEPRRGQMVLWKLPRPAVHHVVNEGLRYFVAREDGHLLAGSTVEDVGFDNRTTTEGIEDISRFARGWLPALRKATPVRTWSGLRPMTTDGLPYLGRIPGWQNGFIATGHFRSGIHLAPITARLMTELMLDQKPTVDLQPFGLAR